MHNMRQSALENFRGRRSRETLNAQHLKTALIPYEYPSIIKEEISIEDYNDMTIITEVPTKFSQEVINKRLDSICAENNTLQSRETTIKTTLIPYEYPSIIKEEVSIDDCKDMTSITEIPTKRKSLHSCEIIEKTAVIPYEYPSIIKEEISIDDCNDMTIITEVPTKFSQEVITERLDSTCAENNTLQNRETTIKTTLIPYEYPSIIKEEISIDDCNDMTSITEVSSKFSQKDIAERFDFTCEEKSTLHSQKYQHKDVAAHIIRKQINDCNFPCLICAKHYKTKSSLRSHKYFYHQEQQPVSCDSCSKIFRNKSTLYKHKKINHCKGQYKCRICSYQLISQKNLDKHMLICENNVCKKCGKVFSSHYNLKQHINTHTGNKPFSCTVCNKSFAVKFNLMQHQMIHNKPYLCDVCGKFFSLKSSLALHMHTKHQEQQPVRCDVCNKSFRNSRCLSVHKMNSSKFPCPMCNKKYNVKSNLTHHLSFPHQEQQTSCDSCSNICCNKHALYYHKRYYHKSKYKCQICNKRLISQKNLDQHILWHKNKVCEECGRTFSSSSRLKKHMIRHTGDKPYLCSFCNKSFTQKFHLIRHQVVHVVKSYVCDFCGDTFKRKDMLQMHIYSHMRPRSLLPHISKSTKS